MCRKKPLPERYEIDDDNGRRFVTLAQNPHTSGMYAMYKEYTPLLAAIIEREFPTQSLRCAEFGGGPGALVKDLTALLPKRVEFTNLDSSQKLLDIDNTSAHKICCDLSDMGKVGSFDVGIMRYVLQYNSKEAQERILRNIRENTNSQGIFLLQQCGPTSKEHQSRLNTMFEGMRLYRQDAYWSSWDEVKQMLAAAGFRTKELQTFTQQLTPLFVERYRLTPAEHQLLKERLGEFDWLRYSISVSR